MSRDTTIIYRSFHEAIKDLPKEDRAEIWDAIMEYAFNFTEVELTGISKTIFRLIKPQLEANNKRYENGKKPKRKQNGSKTEAKNKQAESKPEANKNKNKNKNKNNNENKNTPLVFPFSSENFKVVWEKLLLEKKWKRKSHAALEQSLEKLGQAPGGEEEAIQMMKNTLGGDWQGVFFLKEKQPAKKNSQADSLSLFVQQGSAKK